MRRLATTDGGVRLENDVRQLLVGAATEGNMVEARRLLETGVDVDGYHNGLTALYVSGSLAVCVCDSVSGPAACVWQCVSQCM